MPNKKLLEQENVRLANQNRKLKNENGKLKAKLHVYEAEDSLHKAVKKIIGSTS